MKQICLALICLMLSVTAMAQRDERTYLIVRGLATPVTVETTAGTYEVYDQVELKKLASPRSAHDANGNQVVVPLGSYKSGTNYHYRYYEFSTLYNTNSTRSDNTQTYTETYSPQDRVANTARESIESVGSHFSNVAIDLMGLSAEGYPNASLKLGYSHIWGEYARANVCLGGIGGVVLYGGIGKKLIGDKGEKYWNESYKGRTSWHAGLGYYIVVDEDECSDISMGISLGKPVVCESMILNLDLAYTYFFGDSQRFGVFGGGGFGIGDLDTESGSFKWNLELGVAVKLWAGGN